MNYNKVFLIGNMTREPELKYTQSQMAVCSFGIAVNQGTRERPETYFGDCVAFGKIAEIIPRFTSKGSSVLVEGSLRNDVWQDRETGKKQTRTRIYVNHIQFLDQRQNTQENTRS